MTKEKGGRKKKIKTHVFFVFDYIPHVRSVAYRFAILERTNCLNQSTNCTHIYILI